ncbi:MAG: hypothetical protein EB165_07645 [Euryarchaeota archaeon]|nr:hypothetical protein [Euryarchaeota archaeon]
MILACGAQSSATIRPMDSQTMQPGMGYELTRHQFFRFLEEMDGRPLLPADWQESWFDQRAALWQHIGAREASRVFTDMGACPSVISITTSLMEWEYVTTSGTCLLALDHRQASGSVHVREDQLSDLEHGSDPDYCIPWDPDLGTLEIPSEGIYRVCIPVERDQPGRTAWTQVRLAMEPGLEYRSWDQEQQQSDPVSDARKALKASLQP